MSGVAASFAVTPSVLAAAPYVPASASAPVSAGAAAPTVVAPVNDADGSGSTSSLAASFGTLGKDIPVFVPRGAMSGAAAAEPYIPASAAAAAAAAAASGAATATVQRAPLTSIASVEVLASAPAYRPLGGPSTAPVAATAGGGGAGAGASLLSSAVAGAGGSGSAGAGVSRVGDAAPLSSALSEPLVHAPEFKPAGAGGGTGLSVPLSALVMSNAPPFYPPGNR